MPKYTLSWDSHHLELGVRTQVMGIVNVTPDSFSDGGKFLSFDAAVAHGEQLVEDGADIIDIGGESTRPFAKAVSAEEEIRRVVPVIEELAVRVPVPISIDTTKTRVARLALDAGASMINDISALRLEPEMADLAAERKVPLILMHMKGTPGDMQINPTYEDVIGEIKSFLADAIYSAMQRGVSKLKLIVDPGIGFGKTLAHNLKIIRQLGEFHLLGVPIMIGPSRKAFIRNLLKDDPENDISPDLPVVETGTQAAIAAAALAGVHLVRVHDVANTCATLKIIDAIRNTRV